MPSARLRKLHHHGHFAFMQSVLRHTHGTHALNSRKGHASVPVQIGQNNLGHASIGTTSGYLTTEREVWLQTMQEFWCGN